MIRNDMNRVIDTHGHRIRRTDPSVLRAQELKGVPKNKEFAQHALVISLASSHESRLKPFFEHNKFDGELQVIEGINGMLLPPVSQGVPMAGTGDIACLKSHRKALEHARDNNWPMVIIFEDDIRFVPDFSAKLKEAMLELPETFDMLWLGGADRNPSYPYSKNLKVNTGMWGGYAYLIRSKLYQHFIDLFQNEVRSCDDYYSMNHKNFQSFKTAPDLVKHIGKHSERILINTLSKNR